MFILIGGFFFVSCRRKWRWRRRSSSDWSIWNLCKLRLFTLLFFLLSFTIMLNKILVRSSLGFWLWKTPSGLLLALFTTNTMVFRFNSSNLFIARYYFFLPFLFIYIFFYSLQIIGVIFQFNKNNILILVKLDKLCV